MIDPQSLRFEMGGMTRIAPCLSLLLHLDRTDKAELADFAEAALTLLEPTLTHYETDTMRRGRSIDAKAREVVQGWMAKPRELHAYQFRCWGGEALGTSSSLFEILLRYGKDIDALPDTEREARRERLSKTFVEPRRYPFPPVTQILLTVPVDGPVGPQGFRDWLLQRPLIRKGRWASGLAGYRLNRDTSEPNGEILGRINERYDMAGVEHPGLDLDFTNNKLQEMSRWDAGLREMIPHIARVNWLTFVSRRSLPKLGLDKATLVRQLEAQPGVTVHPVEEGLVIQAAPQPLLGERVGDPALAGYRHVASLLRPIRMPVQALGSAKEVTVEWFEDLDRRP